MGAFKAGECKSGRLQCRAGEPRRGISGTPGFEYGPESDGGLRSCLLKSLKHFLTNARFFAPAIAGDVHFHLHKLNAGR
jgi:hypothetical protein